MPSSPERKAERRRECIARIHAYLGGACAECGASDSLHIDHIEPETKRFNPSQKHYLDWSILVVELDKCQLLCKTHHLEKSKSDGSKPNGERVGGSKLTREIVREIRASRGLTHEQLAAEYGVCRSNIGQILNNITWREVISE